MNCSCEKFDKLLGASVNGYISTFLEADKSQKNRFVCKVCGSIWEKYLPDGEVSKSSLVKIEDKKTKTK